MAYRELALPTPKNKGEYNLKNRHDGTFKQIWMHVPLPTREDVSGPDLV
jgi:hypothetical protein